MSATYFSERHRDVFRYYEIVNKRYGVKAPMIKRRYIYEEVGQLLGYSWQRVGQIVNVMLKAGYHHLNDEELEEIDEKLRIIEALKSKRIFNPPEAL